MEPVDISSTKKLSVRERAKRSLMDIAAPIAVADAAAVTIPSATIEPRLRSGPAHTIAAMMMDDAIKSENQKLKEEIQTRDKLLDEFSQSVVNKRVSPLLIDDSEYANRHSANYETESFIQLKNEIEFNGGNVQPVKLRPKKIQSTGETRYEIIFGHRRVQACRLLGLDVFALIESMSDKDLWLQMTFENEARKDLSPYEQAIHYKRAIDKGLYKNWSQLGESIGKKKQSMARYAAMAEMPASIVDLFYSPLDISLRHSEQIMRAINTNPDIVMQRAKEVEGKVLSAVALADFLTKPQEKSAMADFSYSFGKAQESKFSLSVEFDKRKLSKNELDSIRQMLFSLDSQFNLSIHEER